MTLPKTPDLAGLMEAHQRGVWRYLRMLGCERALADDLTQECFLKVLEAPFEYRGDGAAAAYLRRMAYNLFISHVRRKGREQPCAFEEAEEAWLSMTPERDSDARLEALEECLDALGERGRRVIELRYRDGLEGDAIARELETSPDGVYSLLKRAKQTLRDCVARKVNDRG